MFRQRHTPKVPNYQHKIQENLDNTLTSIQAQLELHDKLKSIAEDLPNDHELQKAKR